MRLDNAVIATLLVLIPFALSKGNSSVLEGLRHNFTTGSSPWLKKVINHPRPRPRPPRCSGKPWICREGYHPPPAIMRCCKNQCVDVYSDANNCGWCGIRCPFTWQCCRGFCVNTNISPFNCGRCGNRCPWKVRCVYGMCGYAEPLPPPWPHPPFPFPPKPPKPWPPHPPHHPKGVL